MNSELSAWRLATLESRLRHRLDELHSTLRQHLAKSDDDRMRLLADRVRDLKDESVADLLTDVDLAEVDREVGEVREVEAALARVRVATYGVCVSCSQAIPYERLAVQPAANRCLKCQSVHEKTHVGAAMSSY